MFRSISQRDEILFWQKENVLLQANVVTSFRQSIAHAMQSMLLVKHPHDGGSALGSEAGPIDDHSSVLDPVDGDLKALNHGTSSINAEKHPVFVFQDFDGDLLRFT